MAGAHTLDGPWLSQDPSKGVRIALNHPPAVVQSNAPSPLHSSGAKSAMADAGTFGGALLSLPPPSCRLNQPERGRDKHFQCGIDGFTCRVLPPAPQNMFKYMWESGEVTPPLAWA